MKIIKRGPEFLKFRISSEDDLWTTAKLCNKGRKIGMLGERRDQSTAGEEGGRAKSAKRKKTWIELIIEYTEFQTFSDTLRVHGIINEAAFDKGSHHTHVVQIGDEIKITIEGVWPKEDLQLINSAKNHSTSSKVAIVVTELDEILLYEVTMHGLRNIATFTMRGGGKYSGNAETSSGVHKGFMKKVATDIHLQLQRDIPLIICGPGMARERLEEMFKAIEANRTIRNIATSMGGHASANEILKEGLALDLLKDHSIIREIEYLEDAFTRIAKQGAVAYGQNELNKAMEEGAIETLLILAELLRDENSKINNQSWSEWSKKLELSRGELVQCSSDHDSGMQLESMGGAIALLRYIL
jgi:protein pelota